MLPVHCHSCLHVICLCSTVAEGSTDQLLKFQLSSVKTKVLKTNFKNGCQYCVHPVCEVTYENMSMDMNYNVIANLLNYFETNLCNFSVFRHFSTGFDIFRQNIGSWQ